MNKAEASQLLLRAQLEEPTEKHLQEVLGEKLFQVYQELMLLASHEYQLAQEWKYYHDGKAWLCKITCKKKTICWLSVWTGYIKTSF